MCNRILKIVKEGVAQEEETTEMQHLGTTDDLHGKL